MYIFTQTALAILTISSFTGYETGAATFGQAIFNALKIVLIMLILAKLHKKRASQQRRNPKPNYIITDNF